MSAVLAFPRAVKAAIWRHLVPPGRGPEQVAFAFALSEGHETGLDVFRCAEWESVPAAGFESRSPVHFELAEATQAKAIKRAHNLGACLVEFHSHTGPWPAAFSGSDLEGFREFVPHILWRLKGRPYFAVVVTRTGFDGFVWRSGPEAPELLAGLLEGDVLVRATGLSTWDPYGATG